MDSLTFILIIVFVWIVLAGISRMSWFTVTNPRIGLGSAFYHTTRLNNLISRIGGRGKIFWKLLWDIGIISGLGILFTGLIVFSINIITFFLPKSSEITPIAITPVIPGITVSFASLPYFVVAIMIGAMVHEFAHGIAAINEKIPLKSTGIFVFLLFFGAFVEPEEDKILSASNRSKMRVMAAGGLANMIVAIFFLTILLIPLGFPLLISPLYETESSGALIIATVPGAPAIQEGVHTGYVIVGIKYETRYETGYHTLKSGTEFSAFVDSKVTINQTLTLYFADKINPITLRTVNKSKFDGLNQSKNKGFIGVRAWDYFKPKILTGNTIVRLIPYWFRNTIIYTFIVNLMLALMNLLPVPFLDGDKLLAAYLGEKNQSLHKWIKYFGLIVLLSNFALSFLFMGWQQI
jgi:membrane-associated protease RseP (regulator of RpoE activity)